MRREMALCHADKSAGEERHKDNQPLFKVVLWRGRKKLEAGILDRDVEEKNRIDVARI